MNVTKLILAALVAAVLATPRAAAADATPTSTITQIKILESNDERHRLFHGVVWLDADKATHNYRWGGKHCGGGSLSAANVQLLLGAFRDRHSVTVDYKVFKYKQQVSRCITGLTVTRS